MNSNCNVEHSKGIKQFSDDLYWRMGNNVFACLCVDSVLRLFVPVNRVIGKQLQVRRLTL